MGPSDDDYKDLDLDSVEQIPAIRSEDISSDDKTTVLSDNIEKRPHANMRIAHFVLKSLLGQGGMGEVWLALDSQLERQVALKLMRSEFTSNPEAVKRFQREARAIAKLNHPNIVQVYSIGQQDNTVYMAIELVDGAALSTLLSQKNKLSLQDATSCILQTVEGLAFAYSKGVVHRDIKPGNIMISRNGTIKITDFGLAKLMQTDSAMTQAGTTLGSPNYMSPEQAKGSTIDHRSDIYSLGITFFQLLAGFVPYKADSPLSVMLMHIQDPLPEPLELTEIANGQAMTIIKKMTAKLQEDRYQDYAELAKELITMVPNANTCIVNSFSTIHETASKKIDNEPLGNGKRQLEAKHYMLIGGAILVLLFGIVLYGLGVFSTTRTTVNNRGNTSLPIPTQTQTPIPAVATVSPVPVLTPQKPPQVQNTPKATPTTKPIVYTPIPGSGKTKTTAIVVPLLSEPAVQSFLDPSFRRRGKDIESYTEVEVIEQTATYVLILDPNDKKSKVYLNKNNVKK